MRLLLLEDDMKLSQAIKTGLTQKGFSLDHVQNLNEAEAALLSHDYAALVLDLGLPDGDGTDFLKKIRNKKMGSDKGNMPVLVLTARDRLKSKIEVLDLGADDYLTKPFDLEELAARIRALVRRSQGKAAPVLICDDLSLNPATHEVYYKDKAIDLSAREFAVLEALLIHRGKILTREKLEEILYSWDKEIASNAVEVYIHNIRKKTDESLIKNIRGVGYTIK